MPRLHAGNHTQLTKPRDVFDIEALNVNDLMSTITRRVRRLRLLECIEHHTNTSVSRCMNETLQTAPIEFGKHPRKL
jgi:hypothetical protein